MKTKIKVTGMSCEHCVKRVIKAIESIAGIKDVQVDLKSGEATFDKPEEMSMNDIVKAIKKTGYEVEV